MAALRQWHSITNYPRHHHIIVIHNLNLWLTLVCTILLVVRDVTYICDLEVEHNVVDS
jgi:hypothetical protein